MIQRCARGMLVRRRLARDRAMKEAVNEFQRTMAVYAARCDDSFIIDCTTCLTVNYAAS